MIVAVLLARAIAGGELVLPKTGAKQDLAILAVVLVRKNPPRAGLWQWAAVVRASPKSAQSGILNSSCAGITR